VHLAAPLVQMLPMMGAGTSRLQLRAKGDSGIYANITSVVLACGGIFIPVGCNLLLSACMLCCLP
jgi:hypothetical protein